eukprot:CAMPEP_0118667736 /NCGR_PEP_ID=MMETSP0785-20121206/19955_1 /TAXON_ID=91992 /ORGANISM="Bolidomonas pacifica, Strain CCMP 1866" /LENGTH=566 /DNA_ID=CAMNT_0006562229 /DNA_START=38 /DNA_END=1734 /DNA_ORIENTATION=+
MSHDIARGGYTKPKKGQRDSSRNYNDGISPLSSTLAAPELVQKYLSRNQDPKSLSGTIIKDRPGNKSANKRKSAKDKKADAYLAMKTKQLEAGAVAAAEAEILDTTSVGFIETENEMERTYKLKQEEIKRHLDDQTSKQVYSLNLTQYSPYNITYSRSGRHMLLTGRTGHVAVMDALTLQLKTEFHLTTGGPNSIRSSTFLHNNTMFALSERRSVYIYDSSGSEVHHLQDHVDPLSVCFLPHHWLLCSVGRAGWLKYTDTSTGEKVGEFRTKLGSCGVMEQNTYNAVVNLGHGNGCVTMWSPASSTPLVKMLCHRGRITALANDLGGNYMVTAGVDKQVKVWDLRTFKSVHSYFSHNDVNSLDISQRGVLAVGAAGTVTFWKDALSTKQKSPYMSHRILKGGASCNNVRFRPYEDVVGIGHDKGFESIVVPGVGESNFDSYEANMFQDKKQRQESEVRSLLDKLKPEMIQLDPEQVGAVERDRKALVMEQRERAKDADTKPKKEKKKARGRNKISKKLARKHKNIMDESKVKLMEKRRMEREGKGGNVEELMSPAEKKRKKGLEEG